MIISVEDAKKFITTTESDEVLEAKLQALELMIREYTNNNFQIRSIRAACQVMAQKLFCNYELFEVGDTIQISQSVYNDGIYTVIEKDEEFITLDKKLIDETSVLVTKVIYPANVKMGVVDMLKWELENRDKVGIQSETISRHSVTYFNMDGANSAMGYPRTLLGFLKPYKRPRF